jgi:hypothetical protein
VGEVNLNLDSLCCTIDFLFSIVTRSQAQRPYAMGFAMVVVRCTLSFSVYDITGFLAAHPGGKQALLNEGGKDVTAIFQALHKDAVLREIAAPYQIGMLNANTACQKPILNAETSAPGDGGDNDDVTGSFTRVTIDDEAIEIERVKGSEQEKASGASALIYGGSKGLAGCDGLFEIQRCTSDEIGALQNVDQIMNEATCRGQSCQHCLSLVSPTHLSLHVIVAVLPQRELL